MKRFLQTTACLVLSARLLLAIPPEIFPVSDLKPGMHGITYTVLQGEKIEPIDTEILGVARNFVGPQRDLIIARLVDPKTSLTEAVHGMSGSPLYIDGKIVGALSRRIAMFEKDGHCGFTPIQDMLGIGDRIKEGPVPAQPPASLPLSFLNPRAVGKGMETRVEFLGVPLSVSGVSESLANRLITAMKLDRFGLMAVPGGGQSTQSLGPDQLQPGAPVAAVMITGDISMAGTGTLTWRDGNRILGFGHPMLGFGETALPMATAEIITTIPSYERPYKLSNTANVVGTIYQDRLSAIAGVVGPIPAMASYTVERVHNGLSRPPLKGAFVPHPTLTPMLITAVIGSAMTNSDDLSRIFSFRVEGTLSLKGHPDLHLDGVYSGQDMDVILALMRLIDPVNRLYSQQWENLEAQSLHLKLTTSEQQECWSIESISSELHQYEPGQIMTVTVRLRERLGAKAEKVFSIKLPEGLKSGTHFDLRVVSGQSLNDRQQNQGLAAVREVDQLIALLNKRRSNDIMYLQIVTNSPGELVEDRELPSLPESVRAVMDGGNDTRDKVMLPEKIWLEAGMPLSGVVDGQETLHAEIR